MPATRRCTGTTPCAEIGTLLAAIERPRAADRARLGRGSRATSISISVARRTSPRCRVVYTPDDPCRRRPRTTSAAVQTIPTRSSISPSPPAPPARPSASCTRDNTLLANGRDMVRDWGHDPHTVLLSLSPLSHHIAWVGVAQWLLAGCELVTNDPPAGMTRARLDHRDRRHLRDGRADARHGRARRAEGSAASSGWAASRCSTWPARRSRPRWRPAFWRRASSRRTSTA